MSNEQRKKNNHGGLLSCGQLGVTRRKNKKRGKKSGFSSSLSLFFSSPSVSSVVKFFYIETPNLLTLDKKCPNLMKKG